MKQTEDGVSGNKAAKKGGAHPKVKVPGGRNQAIFTHRCRRSASPTCSFPKVVIGNEKDTSL